MSDDQPETKHTLKVPVFFVMRLDDHQGLNLGTQQGGHATARLLDGLLEGA